MAATGAFWASTKKNCRAGASGLDPAAKVVNHRISIIRDQNSALIRRDGD